METSLEKIESEIITSLVLNGDISKLSQPQKLQYYKGYCDRLGLDPLTQPFKILKLNGKEVLYCDRSGGQQLSKLHKVSHEIKSREKMDDLYLVVCRASLPDGRFSESIGAVNISGLKGDVLANTMMKGETKAKRRATLDLLGLGILDETETQTIPGAQTIEIYDCDELKAEYLSLLTQLESISGSYDKKLEPDNWKKEQNTDNFLSAIKFVKDKIQQEKDLRKGLDTPHTIKQQSEAIKNAVARDDFHDERKNKKQ